MYFWIESTPLGMQETGTNLHSWDTGKFFEIVNSNFYEIIMCT